MINSVSLKFDKSCHLQNIVLKSDVFLSYSFSFRLLKACNSKAFLSLSVYLVIVSFYFWGVPESWIPFQDLAVFRSKKGWYLGIVTLATQIIARMDRNHLNWDEKKCTKRQIFRTFWTKNNPIYWTKLYESFWCPNGPATNAERSRERNPR